jgi:predicted Zn-dependent protease with MMP-like domain
MRETFDTAVEEVLEDLPRDVSRRMEEVFVNVADAPEKEEMSRLGVRRREDLLGTYTGVPLTRRPLADSGRLPDTIMLYRLGILLRSRRAGGTIDPGKLRQLIRKTLLHEIGHLYGMDEQDLADRGYG